MAQGSKAKYTAKQKRQAKHIEDGAKKQGKSAKVAARIAYATVNKETGGGKKSGSGRGKKTNRSASRKGGKNSHKGSSYTPTGRKKSSVKKTRKAKRKTAGRQTTGRKAASRTSSKKAA